MVVMPKSFDLHKPPGQNRQPKKRSMKLFTRDNCLFAQAKIIPKCMTKSFSSLTNIMPCIGGHPLQRCPTRAILNYTPHVSYAVRKKIL